MTYLAKVTILTASTYSTNIMCYCIRNSEVIKCLKKKEEEKVSY